eukprot:jgi/Psemu1/28516/gm1.28516_g
MLSGANLPIKFWPFAFNHALRLSNEFPEVFKSDLSASCVHSHSLTRNGRQAYFDVVNLRSESKVK